ncbi:MAG: hypothetical protein Q9179_000731 [Wetmoreana sp. 5 TL-2023]
MEDPNLIATLIAIDRRAENAFCLKDNKNRYLPPARGIAEGPTVSSREATPAQEQPDDDHPEYDSTHRLQLTFGEAPKDTSQGYSFGTDPQRCDVLLGNRGALGISGLHFCITFDHTIDDEFHLILRDSSTHGMAVSYNGQAKKEVRHNFTWIMDLEKEEGKWEIKVHAQKLRFKVELASHGTCKAEYDKKIEEFLKSSRTALPPLGVLGIDSYTTTAQPSQALTPRQLPIYISEQELGSGSFGRVDKVINVSTGAIFARKIFYELQWGMNEERRRQRRKDWLDKIRREIRIMKDNLHENTVQVLHFQEDSPPFLAETRAAHESADSDALIDLLTTGLLRMRPEERLSAGACLTKGSDLGLFDGYSVDSGSATPTRQPALQETNDDDGSTTILLGALWHTEEGTSNHDGNSRTGRCDLNHTSGLLESRNFRAPSSLSKGDGHGSQRGSFEIAIDHLSNNVQSPAELSCPLKARSIYPGGYKRQRSPVVDSANNFSDSGRIKRRPSEIPLTDVPVSHAFEISDRRLDRNGESDQFCTIYNAILALSTDLLGSKSQDIDDRTSTLIGELSKYLARLEIIGIRLARDDISGQAVVATDMDYREIVLARLTPSELISSTAELAAHLLHVVQQQNPRSSSIPTVPVGDSPRRAYINTDDSRSRSWTDNSIDSHIPISTARQNGLTYPSALLDYKPLVVQDRDHYTRNDGTSTETKSLAPKVDNADSPPGPAEATSATFRTPGRPSNKSDAAQVAGKD